MQIGFDLEDDLKKELHWAFKDFEVKIPIRKDLKSMLLDYLTIHKKLIFPKVRNVVYSDLLKSSISFQPKRKEIEHLQELFNKGRNVNFFQSKRLFQTKFHDHLLYEWNIFHFHLSLERDKKSPFVKQVDQLLFVHVDDDRVIFLDVEKHQQGIFADVKWLEILQDTSPSAIEPYIAPTIGDVLPKFNSIERQNLWDKGYTIGIAKIRDKVYFSPGLERTSTRHSLLVVKSTDKILRWISIIKKQIPLNIDNIIETIKFFDIIKIELKLRIGIKTIELIENQTKTILLIYPSIFPNGG